MKKSMDGYRYYAKHILPIYDTFYHLLGNQTNKPYEYTVLLRNSSRRMLISVGIDGSGAAAIRRRLPGCACTGM